MPLYVVAKSPVDLEGAVEFVGVFTSRTRARGACRGAGTYLILPMQTDHEYRSGTLLDCERIVVVGQLSTAPPTPPAKRT